MCCVYEENCETNRAKNELFLPNQLWDESWKMDG